MVFEVFTWYLCTLAVSLAALPVAYRLLSYLPDRGANLARPLGLLCWGYIFWLMCSLGIVQNTGGGILLAFILFLAASLLILRGRAKEFLAWLGEKKRYLITSEVLFVVLFYAWAVVRAVEPSISGTEKPMEMAFINAILRSPTFPPSDTWLSGYAISYYHFGYVIVAMITRITGVLPAKAFNLASALWFAMVAMAAYGLVFNFIAANHGKKTGVFKPAWMAWSLLGSAFILIVSNLEGFLEMLHSRGLFWQQQNDGTWQSAFWSWLNIQEIVNPPSQPFSWVPERAGGNWWWRASRVLQDFNLAGQNFEVIDEFPFFSYYLADLHPHVLAMPFALLAVGIAFNTYLSSRDHPVCGSGILPWMRSWLSGEPTGKPRFVNWLHEPAFWLTALACGGLSFLNTWDFPIYVAIFSAAVVFRRYQKDGWSFDRVWELLELSVLIGAAGILLYLPFYLGFSSQAGGIIPSLSFYSRGIHFWVMFGSLLVPIFLWLAGVMRSRWESIRLQEGLQFALILVGGLWAASFLMAWMISMLGGWGRALIGSGSDAGSLAGQMIQAGDLFTGLHGASDPAALLFQSLINRLTQPGTWLTLMVLVLVCWALFGALRDSPPRIDGNHSEDSPAQQESPDSVDGFILILVLVGAGLTLVPEFFYLRDQFGYRINTIFKFYFQAWMLWGLVAAFSSYQLWNAFRSRWRYVGRVLWIAVMIMALAYPYFGLQMRLANMDRQNLTLDGTTFLQNSVPDDYAAIQWLAQAPYGIVSEAVGSSYSFYGHARVSTHSGLPTVLGWPGHESQWRGGGKEMGTRLDDIQRLYRTSNWDEAKSVLIQYNIRYVYVGSLERSTYRVNETKFQLNMKPVFQSNQVAIYEFIPEPGGTEPAAG